MQPLHRLTPISGRAALLASACLIVPLGAKDSLPSSVAVQRERDQRRIDIQEAEELLAQGDLAYQNNRFGEAVTAFSGARGLIPDAPVSAALRASATERLVLASIEHARALARKGDLAGAIAAVDAVLAPGVAPLDPKALAMRTQLDDPIRTNPALTKEHAANVDEVRRLLYTAEGAHNLGKFDQATSLYQNILRLDPTNTAARRGLEQAAKAKSDYAKAATDQTRSEMLAQVDAGWEMPVAPPLLDPGEIDSGPGIIDSNMIPVANKLDRIIIPSVILDDATLEDAIELLRLRANEFDTLEPDPARRGINFDLQLGGPESPLGNSIRATRINLRLNGAPMSQALRYITEQTKTIYTTDQYAVIIRPHGSDSKTMVTRSFRVPPNFITTLSGAGAPAAPADPFAEQPAGGLLTERRGVREVLGQAGVPFPDGASASLSSGSLIVTNTSANLDLISEIVSMVAKTEPVMVVVTVTMIKCEQTRLKELGFDWLLGSIGFGGTSWIPGADNLNFSGGTTGSGGNLGDIALPTSQVTSNPITAGNRSGGEAIYTDSIDAAIAASSGASRSLLGPSRAPGPFQITKLLDSSSAEMMMRALNQKKSRDIMTTATTVTHSGQASSIRSVKEMFYPQSYEPPELPNSVGNDPNDFNGGFNNGGGRAPFAVTPSHPTDFTKRDIGVILEVTPTAGPDKQFVEVALAPQVVDFDGYVNWGSPISEPTTLPLFGLINPLAARSVELTPNRILEPVFSDKRMNTSVTIADGQTIVLGGLIQQRIVKVEDKTPIFGDIPLVGRLFQSDVDQKISTALVFLVNVKLVDPTGQPFNQR